MYRFSSLALISLCLLPIGQLSIVNVAYAEISDRSKVEPNDEIARLLQQIRTDSHDRTVRVKAAYALMKMGEAAKPAIPDLLPFLQDSNGELRSQLVKFLVEVGELEKIPPAQLVSLLKDSQLFVQHFAARALGKMKAPSPAVLEELKILLKDPSLDVRLAAIKAIGKMPPLAQQSIPELLRLLQDPNSEVRFYAARAFGDLGTAAQTAIPELEKRLTHDNPEVRGEAAIALGRIGAGSAKSKLLGLLADPDPLVRRSAIMSLGVLQESPQVLVPRLIPFLKDPDAEVYNATVKVLTEMIDETVVAPLLQLHLKHADPEIAAKVKLVLDNIGSPYRRSETTPHY
jgi:HEAT repeat protein